MIPFGLKDPARAVLNLLVPEMTKTRRMWQMMDWLVGLSMSDMSYLSTSWAWGGGYTSSTSGGISPNRKWAKTDSTRNQEIIQCDNYFTPVT